MVRLSVIIPTYNRVKLLRKAVESVKNAGTDIEVIVVDDASSDETKEYCERVDGIKYIRLNKNQGTAAARNVGLQESKSPYIAFLDDDDWRIPGTFDLQISILEKDKACGVVYGKILFSNQEGNLTGESTKDYPSPQGDILLQLLRTNFIPLSTVVMKRECIDNVGLFDNSQYMLGIEDWDMWLRISGSYSIRSVEEMVAVYRKPEVSSGQWSSDMTRLFSLVAKAYKKKWFKLPSIKAKLGREFSNKKNELLANASDIILYQALNNSKNFMEKSSRFRIALKIWPRNIIHLKFYKAVVKGILNKK